MKRSLGFSVASIFVLMVLPFGLKQNFVYASAAVSQLVAELRTAVGDSSASEEGKAEIENILNQCAPQTTTQAVCECLNAKLPSRAYRLVKRCYMLSSTS